jgi:nicotinamide-nucleotide amidase
MVRLRLTAFGADKTTLEEELNHHFGILKAKVKEWLVIDEDIPMELAVGRLLKAKGKTMTTAESCTGGFIAHQITSHPGASAYYMGSVVSYDNRIKEEVLHVSHETLTTVGAVSEATVKQMATHVRGLMKTDYAIAVSGIMGPDGGTSEKPVGLVWIAVTDGQRTVTKEFRFRYDRRRNIEMTSMNALNMLRIFISEEG